MAQFLAVDEEQEQAQHSQSAGRSQAQLSGVSAHTALGRVRERNFAKDIEDDDERDVLDDEYFDYDRQGSIPHPRLVF